MLVEEYVEIEDGFDSVESIYGGIIDDLFEEVMQISLSNFKEDMMLTFANFKGQLMSRICEAYDFTAIAEITIVGVQEREETEDERRERQLSDYEDRVFEQSRLGDDW